MAFISKEIKNKEIKNGDIINTIQVISDAYYKEIGKNKKKRKYRKIKCLTCGNITETSELALKHGNTGQCKHCRSNAGRMKGNPNNNNHYDFINDIVIGYTNDNKQFYCDLEDYDKIKNYCWRINKHGYVETQKNKRKILMHRFIMNVPDDKDIDHINRIRCYNLKSNLNIVTKKENNQNNSIYKNNTSGITGVSYDTYSGLWKSYININGKRINGTSSENIDVAINSRKELEKKYFYYLNSIQHS
nr:MAG TPA: endonuclease [Caudoviricetes sp.]